MSGSFGTHRIPFSFRWCFLAVPAVSPALAGESIAPGKLLVYYGWPSSINGTFTVPLAAAEFGVYDVVILGDGLQDGPGDPAPHPDHQNAVGIITHVAAVNTKFFGYIDIGVSTQNLPLAEIQRRTDAWRNMGADGIFLDDFGYDFGVTRQRQNAAVDYIHGRGLPVIANGFFVSDVFGSPVHPNNPTGQATSLGAADFYFFESHQIREGCPEAETSWFAKAMQLQAFQATIGFSILSVTTAEVTNQFDQERFFYAWYSAALFGHAASGWGEYLFSAAGISNAQAPFRLRPIAPVGRAFTEAVVKTGSLYTRTTDEGILFVDTSAHTAGFVADGAPDADGDGTPDMLDVCPGTPLGAAVDRRGRPWGDTDQDCDADLADFQRIQASFSGPSP